MDDKHTRTWGSAAPLTLLSGLLITLAACSDPPARTDSPRRPEPAARPEARATSPATRAGPRRPEARKPPARDRADTVPRARPVSPLLATPSAAEANKRYPWKRRRASYESLATRFPTPAGFTRVKLKKVSYADWLRHLPLLPKGAPVRDYRGSKLAGATAAALAVIDLDVGKRDLQQCMDTLMRLRGEYGWWRKQAGKVRFRWAGGKYFGWAHWSRGLRPKKKGRRWKFVPRRRSNYSYRSFRRYLTYMFMMTGTAHNVREPRVAFGDLGAGHFFVQPPPDRYSLGHAVTILDLAKSPAGKVRALIGEGYTPAQDLHVLKAPGGGAWYTLDPAKPVKTPQWPVPFKWKQFRRFRY